MDTALIHLLEILLEISIRVPRLSLRIVVAVSEDDDPASPLNEWRWPFGHRSGHVPAGRIDTDTQLVVGLRHQRGRVLSCCSADTRSFATGARKPLRIVRNSHRISDVNQSPGVAGLRM